MTKPVEKLIEEIHQKKNSIHSFKSKTLQTNRGNDYNRKEIIEKVEGRKMKFINE